MAGSAARSIERKEVETSSGGLVSYLRAGDSSMPRVIFVHGSPGSARGWKRYLRNPLDQYEFIAIDRPGFGHSSHWGVVPHLREQARAIEPLLVERNKRWPILVGHSFGAAVAIRTAIEYPRLVGGLLIISGSLDPDLEEIGILNTVGKACSFLLPKRLRHCNRELMTFREELIALRPMMGNVRCPVIILHGIRDSLVPPSNVDYMRSHMQSRFIRDVVVLEKGNHFLPWKEEAIIRKAIEQLAIEEDRPSRSFGSSIVP